MKGLVHIVADYSPGDLAFAEMVSALVKHLPTNFDVWGTSVASFDTIALGFEVAQLGLQDEALRPACRLFRCGEDTVFDLDLGRDAGLAQQD